MWIRTIEVDGLRNLRSQDLECSRGMNILIGENAQGKSNFLEAISLACQARSFRQSTNEEILQFGREHGSVTASFEEGGSGGSITCRIALDERHKYAFVDGRQVTQITDFLERTPPMVVFRSESLAIGRGSPEVRRRFLDGLLVGLAPSFARVLRRYRRALMQRNTALKKGWGVPELAGFDDELVVAGVVLLERRRALVEDLGKIAARFQMEFGEELGLSYRATIPLSYGDGQTLEDKRAEYRSFLKRGLHRDRQQGTTTKGPHRDDLSISLQGRSLKRFGSQGQVRSVVISLKIAEIELLSQARGRPPILLLDDVGAELDHRRRERLFDAVSKGRQVFITTTKLEVLGLDFEDCRLFKVEQGEVGNKVAN